MIRRVPIQLFVAILITVSIFAFWLGTALGA
jgi:hypothetical protein